jgi:hypothetical protein
VSTSAVGCQKSGLLRSSGDAVAGSGAPSRAAVPLEVLVLWSFVYLSLRRVLALMVRCWRTAAANEVEVLVLRHQLATLGLKGAQTRSCSSPVLVKQTAEQSRRCTLPR